MSYIKFDKNQLVNLEYSLYKELIRTNRAGSYASTTIVRCNTRKYHGLLVSPQPQIDNFHHLFLSTMDVTVIQQNKSFNLAIHKYRDNIYEPGGHKYIRDFESDPIPTLTYRVGGVVLTAETVFAQKQNRILIRYTLVDAHSPTKLKFNPLLAFRSIHTLSKANTSVNTGYLDINNGISVCMYPQYNPIFIQFSKKPQFTHAPDWYYGIEYTKEKSRGYDYKEDLYTPGTFEVSIKPGESIIISAGLEDTGKEKLSPLFDREIKGRIPRNSFINCLVNAAQQFIIRKGNETHLIAGYHWLTVHGRDTFIALPGLTLTNGDTKTFLDVINTMTGMMEGVFFPSSIKGGEYRYESVDTSLWFFWSLQQYIFFTGDSKTIWEKYGKLMERILEGYKNGTTHNIHMQENGLLYAGFEHDTLTWMNTRVNDLPVINRNGLAVEVNVLWYNAICFYIEIAEKYGKKQVVKNWQIIKAKINESFTNTFWDKKSGFLADSVRGDYKDVAVRPNQLFAASLPYSPVSDEIKYSVIRKVEQELLTPRGIRTLSPKNIHYHGIYKGDIVARDKAYHQGSAFPWLFGHFAEAYLKLHGKSGLGFIKRQLMEFEKEMTEAGIGTISELFNGDPPHTGKGAISHAWSVSELLRLNYLLNKFENNTNQNA